MAHEDHVHQEIKVFKVEPHVKMVTKQYFAACHLPDHTGGLQNLQVVDKINYKSQFKISTQGLQTKQ